MTDEPEKIPMYVWFDYLRPTQNRDINERIAKAIKDAGSVEGQDLTKEEQTVALIKAWRSTIFTGSPVAEMIAVLHAAGYRITRTAPSGAKP